MHHKLASMEVFFKKYLFAVWKTLVTRLNSASSIVQICQENGWQLKCNWGAILKCIMSVWLKFISFQCTVDQKYLPKSISRLFLTKTATALLITPWAAALLKSKLYEKFEENTLLDDTSWKLQQTAQMIHLSWGL